MNIPTPEPYVTKALIDRHIDMLKSQLKHAEQHKASLCVEYEMAVADVVRATDALSQMYREQREFNAKSNSK